jgi:hypothetical protein
LAGGWIDQPFVSKLNPAPPGSMVVVGVEPEFWFMERAGICIGTRNIAMRLWKGELPDGDPDRLVQQLYEEENRGKAEPSGSQDMIGLVYPGINRLDYDYSVEGGVFPAHIESCCDPEVARWLGRVLHLLPVAPRPLGYSPLGQQNLTPAWVSQLGRCGAACYAAILNRDVMALGASLNLNMRCWATMLPHVVCHPLIPSGLMDLLEAYQADYPGAMYSGCGGGYLIVVSEDPVPGAFQVTVRVANQ